MHRLIKSRQRNQLESQRSGELHSDARGTRRLTRAEAANAKKKEGDSALRRKEYQLAITKYTDAIGLDEKNDGIYLHRRYACDCRDVIYDLANMAFPL